MRSHYSGLWIGKATPDAFHAIDTPTNAIQWTLTIITGNPPYTVGLFGSGCFRDTDNIADEAYVFYSLRGTFDKKTREIKFRKIFDQNIICKDFFVEYEGVLDLDTDDNQPILRGSWKNQFEGTHGTFFASLQTPY